MEKLHGFKGALSYVLLRLMAKTTLGELAATDHCRNAVTELEMLDTAFAALRERGPGFPMPHWDALRSAMPDWERLHQLYRKQGGRRT